ncbi:hypothetical protein ACFQZ4_05225 [Catellatospora coxensis]
MASTRTRLALRRPGRQLPAHAGQEAVDAASDVGVRGPAARWGHRVLGPQRLVHHLRQAGRRDVVAVDGVQHLAHRGQAHVTDAGQQPDEAQPGQMRLVVFGLVARRRHPGW